MCHFKVVSHSHLHRFLMEYAKFSLPQMADFDLPIVGVFLVHANRIDSNFQPRPLRSLWEKSTAPVTQDAQWTRWYSVLAFVTWTYTLLVYLADLLDTLRKGKARVENEAKYAKSLLVTGFACFSALLYTIS